MSRLRPYPTYADTDLPWLPKIPKHWEIEPIKYNSYVKGRIGWQNLRSDEFTDEGPYLITGMHFKDSGIDWDSCFHITEERYQIAPEIQIKEGDLLITKDGSIGKLAYIDRLPDKASLNSHLLVIRPLRNRYENKFLFYLLSSSLFKQHILETQTGTTFFGITQEAVVRFPLILPPLHEQRIITAYLDRQTAKIDALIAKKQRLLDLLTEQRAALISQAVTKGLNPAVKVKDSGVAWLGQVPIHWEVKKLKYVVSKIGSGKTPKGGSEIYSKEGVIFIRSQNVHFDGLHLDDVVYIDKEIDEEMSSTRVRPNDVLLNITGASLGRATVVPESLPPANVNQHVSIIRPDTGKIYPKFLNGIIGSQVIQAQIFSTENGAAREGLPYSKISNLIFAMPLAIEEQKEIADYLDQQTKRLSDLATKVETAIERLQEYRAALISSVVTGKVQVSEL